jgi:hypothetical protein
MGTIGGSLANNDPAADYPAAALGLGATIVTSKREIAADDYFEGMFATALEEDEIITAVRFPVPKRAGYSKFRNPASLYAMAGVFVAETGAACASQSPARARMASSVTMGWRRRCPPTSPPGRSTVCRSSEDGMLSDIHGTAAYRANLVKVMAKRAVANAGMNDQGARRPRASRPHPRSGRQPDHGLFDNLQPRQQVGPRAGRVRRRLAGRVEEIGDLPQGDTGVAADQPRLGEGSLEKRDPSRLALGQFLGGDRVHPVEQSASSGEVVTASNHAIGSGPK